MRPETPNQALQRTDPAVAELGVIRRLPRAVFDRWFSFHAMTPDKLQKLLSDTKEIDPWMATNFFQPLLTLQRTAEKRYQIPTPPTRFWEAREFSIAMGVQR